LANSDVWPNRRIALGLALVFATSPLRLSAQDPLQAADSVVLERTLCFGMCPAYRLSVSRSGVVHFASRNPRDESRRAADTIPALQFEWILTRALVTDFLSLPDRIADDKHFCPGPATDHPTAIVTVFMPNRVKRVEDYHGCYWAPVGLRQLEDYIDEITKAGRWIRPASIR